MGNNICFSKVVALVFPSWHCVHAHLKAPEQQTDKTPVFYRAGHTDDDDHDDRSVSSVG